MQAKYPFFGYKRHGPGGPALLIAALLLMLGAPLAIAGPDCDRKPDHPSCSGLDTIDNTAGFYYNFNPGVVCDPAVSPDCVLMEDASPYLGPYTGGNHHEFAPPYEWDTYEENTLDPDELPRPCDGDATVLGSGDFRGALKCDDLAAYGGRVTHVQPVSSMIWFWAEDDYLGDGLYGPPKKKFHDPEICGLLNDWHWPDALQYGAAWYVAAWGMKWGCTPNGCNAGCTADGCSIKIVNNAAVHPFTASEGFPETGVQVRAFVDFAEHQLDFAHGNANPFFGPQNLQVERLQISFGKYAVCETTDLENTWFVTRPIE